MRAPISDRDADLMRDTCFFFIKENYPDASFKDVFNSLKAEHKQKLKNKYSDIFEEDKDGNDDD